MSVIDQERVWRLLDTVPDPEIPVVSVVELGIIQSVEVDPEGAVRVEMTPTFAGCPAIDMMCSGIRTALTDAGIENATVAVTYDPPWTSDRITEEGRRKLKAFGLAPPPRVEGNTAGANLLLMEMIECPFCGSQNTRLDTPFGATLCRAMYYCDSCRQSFEMFKPL